MSADRAVAVAVVGAGPAGLAAATALRARGVGEVVVFERESTAGGMPRHCAHPPFGLREFSRLMTGPAYARRLVAEARAAGVEICLRHSVVRLGADSALDLATPDGPCRVRARRVVLATGARETPRAARLIGGAHPLGVLNTGALQACLALEHLRPFRRPLVVGTELVSLSALATCLRHGIRPVAVVEAAARPVARWPLSLFPRLLGLNVQYGTELVSIHGGARVEAARLRAADGREFSLSCDGVLLTGGFVPEAALVRASHLALDPASGGPAIDPFGRCSDPVFFAAGNGLRGVESAFWCHREGRRLGETIARDLAGDLPPPSPARPLGCAAPLRWVVPRNFAAGEGGVPWLQLRVGRAVRGHLVLRAGGREVWRGPLVARPERRILVERARLPDTLPAGELTLELEE